MAQFILKNTLSGSNNSGQLEFNTTKDSLVVGNGSDIVTIAKLDELNNGNIVVSGNVTASNLKLSGNASIDGNVNIIGNLTFGDSSIDTVTVVASLSSSLIPQQDGTFNIGGTGSKWNQIYANGITASVSGSVNGVDVTTLTNRVISIEGFTASVAGTNQHTQSVNTYTASVSSSVGLLQTFSGSQYKNDSSSVNTRVTNLESTGSVLTLFSSSISTSVGLLQLFSSSQYKTDSSSFDSKLNAIESYTASLKTAIELTGSNVTIQGDLFVRGTTTTINSTIVNLSASFIEVDAGGAVNGGIYVIDRVGGGAGTGSLLWDVTANVWKAGEKGLEVELVHTNDLSALSTSVYKTDITQSNNITINSASAWGAYTSASTYSSSFYTTINNTTQSVLINSQSAWGAFQSASSYSASIYTRDANQDTLISTNSASAWGAYTSASSYSSSFYTTINNTTQSVTTLSSSIGLLQTFSGSEYKPDSSSFDIRLQTVEAASYLVTSGSAVLQYTTAGTLGNILIKGAASKSIQVIDTIEFYGLTTPNGSISAEALVMTGSISASAGFSGSLVGIGNVTLFSSSIDQRIKDATNEQFLGGFATTSSLSDLSASIYQTDATQSANTTIISASTWGAYSSASAYSASAEMALMTLSSSIYQTDATQSYQIVANAATASAYSASQATLNKTFATTGSNTFNGSQNIVGDITASGNLYVSGTIYTYELHSIIESSSVIFSSGSTVFGDTQSDNFTITGSLLQTGSTSFSELTGSLASFSSSLNTRIGNTNVETLSASIYQTDATQSNNILINSQSAWGAFQSASSYSASFYTTLNNLSSSIATTTTTISASAWGAFQSASSYSGSTYTTITTLSSSIALTDLTQSNNITTISASAWGAFQSASSYSGSFYTTINSLSSSITTTTTTNSASTAGAFASASAYSASAVTTYAKLAVANTFTQNQIISGSLTVTGDVVAYASSDERLKDNIQLISNPIQKVQQLRGVEFDWNDKVQMKTGQHDYGVIAQDILSVMPELVKQRYDGYYGVDYDKIVGLLIEVVKNQENRIKELENKLDS